MQLKIVQVWLSLHLMAVALSSHKYYGWRGYS